MTTRAQIIALRNEAKQAGDYRTADLCGQALAGDEDSVRECERVIASEDNPTAYGYTFDAWLRATGRQDSASQYDLRAAWRAGEDPAEYKP